MNIRFTVLGEPKPQPRPRAFARKMGGGKFAARVYDASTAEGWKGQVALAAKPHIPPAPCTDALSVTMVFDMPRPKAHLNSKGEVKPAAPKFPTGRNDADNLAKAVLDALTQIGLWQDDGQVVHLDVTKRFSVRGGAEVIITTAEVTA